MHWANFESRNLCCLQSFKVKTCFHTSNRPLPIHVHSHKVSKFLDIETLFLLNKCCQSESLFNFKGKCVIWFKYYIENPNAIKKLTINPNPNQLFLGNVSHKTLLPNIT